MDTNWVNICIRCGKDRILGKTWVEKLQTYNGISLLEHTEMICPDKECQKVVDNDHRIKKEKADQMKADKEARMGGFKTKMVGMKTTAKPAAKKPISKKK